MRIPLAPVVDSRDGSSDKDAKAVNLLKEDDEGTALVALRPGLVLNAYASGVGNGLVSFNDELISVFGSTLGAKGSIMTVSQIEFGTEFPVNVSIHGYSYRDSVYVAVGIDNITGVDSYIYSSTDGLSWTLRETVNDCILFSVATDGNRFVVIGESGIFAYSDDGITWSTYEFDPGGYCVSIIWDGVYFIIESSGQFYRSTDGVTWDAVGVGGGINNGNTTVATSGARTVAIIEDDDSGENWLWVTSDHGSTWTRGGTNIETPMSVCYGNGKFCCFTTDGVDTLIAYSSTDGVTYTKTLEIKLAAPNMSNPVSMFSNGVFVVCMAWNDIQPLGAYITSENLTDWNEQTFFAGVDALPHFANIAKTATGFLYGVDTVSSIIDIDRTIPTITTVVDGEYDFAQSVI